MTEPTQPTGNSNFRLTQALYNTILTNLKVILGLFVVALVGWLFLYLMPLTQANSTYNANSHETALRLVVANFVDVKKGGLILQDMGQINEAETANSSAQASCDFLDPKQQTANQAKITAINTALTGLYSKHLLANQYQLDDKGLWQSACQQGETTKVSEDDMAFALKTLASPDKLMQLNWAERQKKPLQANTNGQVGVASLPENWLTQTNPWYGLPGCVYIKTPSSKDNPTGYSYVEGGSASKQQASQEMAQLCNHPKLVPEPAKAEMFQQPTNQDSALSNAKNQATNALNQLTQNQTPKPAVTIKSTQDNQTALPPNLGLMYSELANIHSSHFDKQLLTAYEQYQAKKDTRNWWQKLTAPPLNAISLDGANVKIGYNMALTFDPSVQNTAQHVAECVTQRADSEQQGDCNAMLANLQGVTNQLYENALVRSIGIAVIDVKTQGILALASSESPCYAKDNGASDSPTTPNQTTGCPTLWKKDWSGQNLLNHALFQTVYPGSTVKTVQALGLVRANPAFKNPESADYRYLKQVLASSSTERVANFLFCQKTTSDMTLSRNAQGVCPGITAYQKAAQDMGWSANCEANTNGGSPFCGSKDLLFGLPYNSDPMLQSRYFSGVLLTDTKQNLQNLNFTANQVASCVAGNDGRMSGSCSRGGDTLNEAMNETYGAGNAKTSVLGVADSFMSLLLADNGQKQRRGAHIVQDLWGVNQIPLRPKAWRGDSTTATTASPANSNLAILPLTISQADARATLSLLSGTLLAGTGLGGGNGTAYTACTQAIGDCSWTNGIIVGKTGTPGFNFPTVSNGSRYYTPDVTTSMVQANCYNPEKPSFLCQNRPYKWFVYGIKDKNGKWDKAVAVLVERNWTKSGLVDDPHDGINRAVQAGMLLAKQMYSGK